MSATPKTFTPKDLAESIGISPKILRAHLRTTFARVPDAKNTAWIIDAKTAAACRKHFEKNAPAVADDAS